MHYDETIHGNSTRRLVAVEDREYVESLKATITTLEAKVRRYEEVMEEAVFSIYDVLQEYKESNPYNRKDVRFPSKGETKIEKVKDRIMELLPTKWR